jgi:hypothetical protein
MEEEKSQALTVRSALRMDGFQWNRAASRWPLSRDLFHKSFMSVFHIEGRFE